MCQPGEALGCPSSALGTRPVCASLTPSAREDPLDEEAAGVGRVMLGPWRRDRRDDKGADGPLEPSGPLVGSLCWTWGPPSVGPDFSWAGAARGGEGPAADRLPPSRPGLLGSVLFQGQWSVEAGLPGPQMLATRWPTGVTLGALHLHGRGPDRTRAQLLCSQWALLPTASVLTPQTASPRRSCIVLGLSPDVPWSA